MNYLINIKGHWYFSIRVPKDLIPVLDLKTIKKSLKTQSCKDAKIVLHSLVYRLEGIFAYARAGLVPRQEIQSMLKRCLGKCSDESEQIVGNGLSPTMNGRTKPQKEGKLLSWVMELYRKEKIGSGDWVYKSMRENELFFKLALYILGDRNILTLGREDFLHYRESLSILPLNFFKNRAYKGVDLEKVLEKLRKKPVKPLSVKTRNKHVQGISALMNWAVEQGFVEKNFAVRLSRKDIRKPSEIKKVYNHDDLEKLLSSPVYAKVSAHRPERFFIPLIALFTGMRLNEICRLQVDDVQDIEGIACFVIIHRTEEDRVKSEASERVIPIHPTLINIGLLRYVKDRREKDPKVERLWPNVSYTKGNKWAGATGEWFGKYNRQYITGDPLKTFHSFRHTLITNLKHKLVPPTIIKAIDGHKGDKIDMTEDYYGKDFPPSILLKEGILKVDHGVSFDGIKWPDTDTDKGPQS